MSVVTLAVHLKQEILSEILTETASTETTVGEFIAEAVERRISSMHYSEDWTTAVTAFTLVGLGEAVPFKELESKLHPTVKRQVFHRKFVNFLRSKYLIQKTEKGWVKIANLGDRKKEETTPSS